MLSQARLLDRRPSTFSSGGSSQMLSRASPPGEQIEVIHFGDGQSLILLKGTTNFGFIYSGGVLLGADGRISSSSLVNGVYRDYLIDDHTLKVRSIGGYFRGRIFCTLMGSEDQWENLYRWLNAQVVTSVEDAVWKAMAYLHEHTQTNVQRLLDYKTEYGFNETFGMLIGGFTELEGHRLGVVYLDHMTVHWRIMDNAETLGSGSIYADQVLRTSTRVEREAYGEQLVMTRPGALHLGLCALSHSSVRDPHSGGQFRDVHVHRHNVRTRVIASLDSYVRLYNMDGIDMRSLFILYVWPYPVASDLEIQEMLSTVWPNNDVPLDDIEAWHYVAQRANIYIHRLLFSDARGAIDAFHRVVHLAQPGNDAILEDLIVDGFVIRSGVFGYPVYIGRSSLQFLHRMTQMQRPPPRFYPAPPWALI